LNATSKRINVKMRLPDIKWQPFQVKTVVRSIHDTVKSGRRVGHFTVGTESLKNAKASSATVRAVKEIPDQVTPFASGTARESLRRVIYVDNDEETCTSTVILLISPPCGIAQACRGGSSRHYF